MATGSHTPLWCKILKVFAWTLMAIFLAIIATFICIEQFLQPEQLTPICNRLANKMLDAKVEIGRVELSFKSRSPFIFVSVDDLSVVSDKFAKLPTEQRDSLPVYADTLLTLDKFSGGLNIASLLADKIALQDVQFFAPQINIVTLNDSTNNFSVFPPTSSADTDTTSTDLPAVSINRFSIDNPKPIRYDDLSTNRHILLNLKPVELIGESAPTYSLTFGGNLSASDLIPFNLHNLKFALDGAVDWQPEDPYKVNIKQLDFAVDSLKITAAADIDMTSGLTLNSYNLEIAPLPISRALEIAPDSLLKANGINPEHIRTNLAIGLKLNSTAPYNLTTDTIPNADIRLNITKGIFNYGLIRFNRFGGTVSANLRGENLNAATINISDFTLQGPATDLTINASATNLITDPIAKGQIVGNTNLKRLPPVLKNMIKGSVAGKLTADLKFSGRQSMLSKNDFHRLNLSGDIDADNFQFEDSIYTMFVDHACFKFGSNRKDDKADSLLTASIVIDSASVIQADSLNLQLKKFCLGVGTSSRKRSADTTVVIPIGGGINIENVRLALLGDSTSIRASQIQGRVTLHRFEDNDRLPYFAFNIFSRSFAFGTPDMRLMLMQPKIDFSTHKKPRIERNNRQRQPRHRQNIPTDSLKEEVIDWGTTSSMRRFLLGWELKGSIEASRARFFTTAFPIRSRLSNFNLSFTNDSIYLTDVIYKAGGSDFKINGSITNIKRSLTSRRLTQPLKINFDVLSDTIDINELAATAFRVADSSIEVEQIDNMDATFDDEVNELIDESSTSTGPFLIPRNIDMHLNMQSKNVLYGDMVFNDFTGEVLAFRGALNMRKLAATSGYGNINLSALYSAPRADDLRFGFGMQVNKFNINRFTRLVPAIDSIMPMLNDIHGIIDADIAATCNIDNGMNIVLPSLAAAVSICGDSLKLIDKETYRTIGKWLLFKDKTSNIIQHMDVELTIENNLMQLYPVIFDIDRYRLGIQGHNDLAMNFDYHVAVIKSPLPFKFGINIKGNPDDFKIRVGKARLKEGQATNIAITDTTRINLLNQIENIFRRGVDNSRFRGIEIPNRQNNPTEIVNDTISHADSLHFIQRGLIPNPTQPCNKPQQTAE